MVSQGYSKNGVRSGERDAECDVRARGPVTSEVRVPVRFLHVSASVSGGLACSGVIQEHLTKISSRKQT